MKTNFENEVVLTLRVSNDSEKRSAVRKVSDKMISISAYLNTGKDQNGDYNPLLDFEVHVFTKNAKTPTTLVDGIQPKSGDYITVKGSLGSKGYVSNGKTYKDMVISAHEIYAPKVDESETPNAPKSNIWD